MRTDIEKAAAALGRQGGISTSEAKQNAARENGKKGGRPKNKYWRVYNKVGSFGSVIAITTSPRGEEQAKKKGYTRIIVSEMTKGERNCLKDWQNNNPTYFPAIYLGD